MDSAHLHLSSLRRSVTPSGIHRVHKPCGVPALPHPALRHTTVPIVIVYPASFSVHVHLCKLPRRPMSPELLAVDRRLTRSRSSPSLAQVSGTPRNAVGSLIDPGVGDATQRTALNRPADCVSIPIIRASWYFLGESTFRARDIIDEGVMRAGLVHAAPRYIILRERHEVAMGRDISSSACGAARCVRSNAEIMSAYLYLELLRKRKRTCSVGIVIISVICLKATATAFRGRGVTHGGDSEHFRPYVSDSILTSSSFMSVSSGSSIAGASASAYAARAASILVSVVVLWRLESLTPDASTLERTSTEDGNARPRTETRTSLSSPGSCLPTIAAGARVLHFLARDITALGFEYTIPQLRQIPTPMPTSISIGSICTLASYPGCLEIQVVRKLRESTNPWR
ncbi:hypothetical protein MSAN_01222000 [Mycena sanguinolenta]|uniref:Uncharacterized protein n=1 Tax=Mycena sanguinolenta TaxID=230812 RepID=A0A8H7D1R2_9AGAR|nr:hypothetical protein MSAN_01222000 [Mycena sanguinolenta]